MDQPTVQKTALSITRGVGSPASIVIHSIAFAASFLAVYFGVLEFERMLLILTTIVSLEAIYLAIFIQMTINYQAAAIEEVQEDVEEIQEDVGEIQEDMEEISEDVDELQEDVEEMSEEEKAEETAEEQRKAEQKETLGNIEETLQKLIGEIAQLKQVDSSKDVKPLF